MSATDHTKNYNLTQFLPTDKPSWESDYNSDMEKIDTALKDISEKPGIPGPQGEPGKNGENGENGADGKSAYQIAVENGFEGTEEEWLASLKGKDGKNGTDGTNGTDGEDGQSAYQIAVNNGFVGSEEEWLASLKGKDGTDATVDITQEEGVSMTAVMSQDATTKGMQGIREKIVSDLLSYYTKAEVDQMISTIPKFAIAVVETLPTENISATTVYLVPSGESSPNLYKEYIYVDGKWESLGEQSVDLSDYYTKSQAFELFVPQTRTVNGQALSDNINIAIPDKTSQLQNDSDFVDTKALATKADKFVSKILIPNAVRQGIPITSNSAPLENVNFDMENGTWLLSAFIYADIVTTTPVTLTIALLLDGNTSTNWTYDLLIPGNFNGELTYTATSLFIKKLARNDMRIRYRISGNGTATLQSRSLNGIKLI